MTLGVIDDRKFTTPGGRGEAPVNMPCPYLGSGMSELGN